MNIIVVIIIVLLNIYFISSRWEKENRIQGILYIVLFFIHLSTTILFYNLNYQSKMDSYMFFNDAEHIKSIYHLRFVGSKFMSSLMFPFIKLGLNYLTCTMIFSTLGFYTFLKYIDFIKLKIEKHKSVYTYFLFILFFIPSLHYWTSGISKETLIFFLMFVFFNKVFTRNYMSIQLILALLIIFLVRPYIGFIMIASLYLHLIFLRRTLNSKTKNFVILMLIISILFLPALKYFLKIDSLNVQTIINNYNQIIIYSQSTGNSSIDLESSTFLGRIWLVMFRPLFYDSNNIFQFIISIENLIYLVIVSFLCVKLLMRRINFKLNYLYLFLCFSITVLFYSIYMYNLGLASRMRIMFMPYFLTFIIISCIGTKVQIKSKEVN